MQIAEIKAVVYFIKKYLEKMSGIVYNAINPVTEIKMERGY